MHAQAVKVAQSNPDLGLEIEIIEFNQTTHGRRSRQSDWLPGRPDR